MQSDADTKVIERDEMLRLARKSKPTIFSPLLVAVMVCAFLVLACAVVMVVKKTQRMKPTGTMEATYVGTAKARDFIKSITADEGVVIPPIPIFNHVIFRLGDAEIFRFTYEGGGEGLQYSFEVVEGSR